MADTTDSAAQGLEKAATELKRKIIGGRKQDAADDTTQDSVNVDNSPQDRKPVEQLENIETKLENTAPEPGSEDPQMDSRLDADKMLEQSEISDNSSDPAVDASASARDAAADDELKQKMQSLRQSVGTEQPPNSNGGEPLSEKVDEALEKARENRERMDEIPSGNVQDEIEGLREENRELEAEVEQTRELLGEIESENESLASEVEELADRSHENTGGVEGADTDFEEIESHLESVDERLEKVSDEVSEHGEEIDSLHEKRREIAEKLESLALRVESNEHGQGRLAEELESLSKELDRYERRLHEENAPTHMIEEKDRMRDILDSASEAVDMNTGHDAADPEQQEVEKELSVFQGRNQTVTEQDFTELFELVEENSGRIEELSQELEGLSADGQALSAVNQEVAGLRGRMQRNEREIQRILDTVEELSEILKMELRSGGL